MHHDFINLICYPLWPMRAQWNLFYLLLLLFSQSRPTLANPMDYTLPGSSVHGISQAKILEWAAISYSSDLPNSGMEPAALQVSCMAGRFFTTEPPGKSSFKVKETKTNVSQALVCFRGLASTIKVLKYHTNKCISF